MSGHVHLYLAMMPDVIQAIANEFPLGTPIKPKGEQLYVVGVADVINCEGKPGGLVCSPVNPHMVSGDAVRNQQMSLVCLHCARVSQVKNG